MPGFDDTAPLAMRGATPQHIFGLAYRLEPIMRLKDEVVVGGEVLWHGRLPRLGYTWQRWYSRLGRLQAEYGRKCRLFVNLDTTQILRGKILVSLLEGAPNLSRLILEWTEKPASKTDMERAAATLRELRTEFGVGICVDDFGAGMDGIHRLNLCQPDIVKIDGSLLHAARRHPSARVLYRHVTNMIKDTGAVTVAEWIENAADLEFARDTGVELGQGYRWPHAQGRV